MLVLTRKVGQSIVIGDGVKISVIDVQGRQVRLGVEAPADTPIYREEVYQRVQAENLAAASARPDDLNQALSLVTKVKHGEKT